MKFDDGREGIFFAINTTPRSTLIASHSCSVSRQKREENWNSQIGSYGYGFFISTGF